MIAMTSGVEALLYALAALVWTVVGVVALVVAAILLVLVVLACLGIREWLRTDDTPLRAGPRRP